MSVRKITLLFLILLIAGGLNFFLIITRKGPIKEPPERGEIIYLKVFKNGINPQESPEKYEKVFKKAQNLIDLPLKYPKRLPEGYKLFKISAWQEEKGAEGVNIFLGEKNTNINLEKNLNFIKENNPKTTLYPPLEKDDETILIKETNIEPSFESWQRPKEITLNNGWKAFIWSFSETDPWSNLLFKKIIYLGYSKKNSKKYYYLINSNLSENNLLKIANFIIEAENKNE